MRRSRIDIIVDLLEVTKNGVNKTAIVYKTNLNFRLANKYLLHLVKQGLLEKKSDKYFTSDTGKIFLGKAKDLTMQLETIIQTGKENTKHNENPIQKEPEITIHYDAPLPNSQDIILLNKPTIERVREITIQPETSIQMVG